MRYVICRGVERAVCEGRINSVEHNPNQTTTFAKRYEGGRAERSMSNKRVGGLLVNRVAYRCCACGETRREGRPPYLCCSDRDDLPREPSPSETETEKEKEKEECCGGGTQAGFQIEP